MGEDDDDEGYWLSGSIVVPYECKRLGEAPFNHNRANQNRRCAQATIASYPSDMGRYAESQNRLLAFSPSVIAPFSVIGSA
jgi:hypothetical protein